MAAFTQKGSGKDKANMTEDGCKRGRQCSFQHPATIGRCLRCGSTKHMVADCKRPRKDVSTGNSKAKPAPKPKAEPKAEEQAGLGKGASQSQQPGKAKAKTKATNTEASAISRLTGPLYPNLLFLYFHFQQFTVLVFFTPPFTRHFAPRRCLMTMVFLCKFWTLGQLTVFYL